MVWAPAPSSPNASADARPTLRVPSGGEGGPQSSRTTHQLSSRRRLPGSRLRRMTGGRAPESSARPLSLQGEVPRGPAPPTPSVPHLHMPRQHRQPRDRRPRKELPLRHERGKLAEHPGAQADLPPARRLVRARIERRPAGPAERLLPPPPALGGLDVDRRRPLSSRKSASSHGATTRNAVPEIFWQSVQWQIRTRSGSISASNAIAPQ